MEVSDRLQTVVDELKATFGAREFYVVDITEDKPSDDAVGTLIFGMRDSKVPALAARGLTIGLISNSHRCLTSFQEHFALQAFVSAAVSSAEHGRMKPHPSIFAAALELLGHGAAECVMVGDDEARDIAPARALGMRFVHVTEGADLSKCS